MTWNGWEWLAKYNESQLKYFALSLDTNTTVEMSATTTIVIWPTFDIATSFPTYIVDACYMVPVRNALPNYLYIKRPFALNLWLMLVLFVIFSSLILYQFSKIWLEKETQKEYFAYFELSICVFLNLSSKAPSNIPKWSIYLLYLTLFNIGFIINSYYNTYLSAFLTTVLYEGEIKTVDDLMNSGITILNTKSLALQHMKLGKFPIRFLNSFEIVDDEFEYEIRTIRDSLNTNYGYYCESDRWNHFRKQQSLLRRKLFTWTNICFGRYYVTFPMLHDNHLSEPLKYFSMSCQQFGLFEAWSARSFRDALAMRMFSILRDGKSDDFKSLGLDFFLIAWWTLTLGLGLSCVAFVFELSKKFKIVVFFK